MPYSLICEAKTETTMAETKLSANKYDIMQTSHDTSPKIVIVTPSPSATAISLPADQVGTIWDMALDEVTATVLAELRF